MIKAVIFDADGVVVKSKMFSAQLEKDFGIPLEKLLPFFAALTKKYMVGKGDMKQDLEKYIGAWGWHGGVDKLMDYWFHVESRLDERVVAKAAELRRRGIFCYVGTNQEKYRTAFMKQEMGFEMKFDGVWSSSDLGVAKPSKKFFELIHARINRRQAIAPEEIMFWDDRMRNVIGAASVGMDAHLFEDYDGFEKKLKEVFDI